jgi:hypothetical protein
MNFNNSEWREFEQLVALIEAHLCPDKAIVKSPDRIPDKITCQLREVDASIRYTIGSVPILITVECRKRSSIQDDTWIEQLAMKKQKIGANQTIAVSSKGFTRPAIKSAKMLGIELRKLNDLPKKSLSEWFDFDVPNIQIIQWAIKNIEIRFKTPKKISNLQLSDSINDDILKHKYDAEILFSNHANDKLTLRAIGEKTVSKGWNTVPEISGIHGVFSLVLPNDHYYMPTNMGNIFVMSIELIIELHFNKASVPISKVFQYGTTEHPILQVAEGSLPVANDIFKFQFFIEAGK